MKNAFRGAKLSKIEPLIVVSADFDDLPDCTFVRSRRTFALLIESVHLHLLLYLNSHGHLTLQVCPCGPRDPDRARSREYLDTNLDAPDGA